MHIHSVLIIPLLSGMMPKHVLTTMWSSAVLFFAFQDDQDFNRHFSKENPCTSFAPIIKWSSSPLLKLSLLTVKVSSVRSKSGSLQWLEEHGMSLLVIWRKKSNSEMLAFSAHGVYAGQGLFDSEERRFIHFVCFSTKSSISVKNCFIMTLASVDLTALSKLNIFFPVSF